jgi:cytochrome c-type biogenesis protein CcmH/NrfF
MPLKKLLIILPLVLALLGGVVWMVRLEGRVNGHDRELLSHEKRFDAIKDDIRYVRDRIDRALERER